jgi:hypothetical protein
MSNALVQEFAALLDAPLEWDDGWVVRPQFAGAWPIPSPDRSFGKRSSCIVGSALDVSCAEVEIALRGRDAGFRGGWMNGYNPSDRRFPEAWREAVITRSEAEALIASVYPGRRLQSAGMPDLVLVRDGGLVAAECKRLRGYHYDNDCVRKPGGDRFNANQQAWARAAAQAGISVDSLVSVWWTRVDRSPCASAR